MKKIFLFELFWFVLAQIFGVFMASNWLSLIQKTGGKAGREVEQISFFEFDILKFLIAFAGVNLFIFLILKFKKGIGVIFKLFFILTVFLGGFVFFQSWHPGILSLLIISALIIFWYLKPYVWLHNLVLIIGVAGIGGVVGPRLQPEFIIFLFFIISIYDIISVYKTKQTVKLAKGMMGSFAVLGLIIPRCFSDFGKKLKDVRIGDPEQKFLILGSGDIIMPLVLACSFLPQGLEKSLIMIVFSSLGLLFSFWLFNKLGRKPMPALPPIFVLSLVGYLIVKIIYG